MEEKMPFILPPVLARQAAAGQLTHAYILSGEDPAATEQAAKALAAAMLCEGEGGEAPCGVCRPCRKIAKGTHPDLVDIAPEAGKDLTVGQIRALRSDAYIRPNEGARKVYLLHDAQRMNPSAQNALLKVLEEGPRYAAFLLLCGNAGALLETIRSRCEQVWVEKGKTISPEEKQRQEQLAHQAGLLAGLLLRGDRWGLIRFTMPYEKAKWDELTPLLEETRKSLIIYRGRDNTAKAVELAEALRQVLDGGKLNLNAGAAIGKIWSLC